MKSHDCKHETIIANLKLKVEELEGELKESEEARSFIKEQLKNLTVKFTELN
jgi:hypothetical protein